MAITKERYGDNIRAARKAAGYTQVTIAAALGVDQRTYSNWETGRAEPSNSMLKHIALACGTTTDQLLGIDPSEPGALTLPPTDADRANLPSSGKADPGYLPHPRLTPPPEAPALNPAA